MPIVALALIPWLSHYLLFIIYLQPPPMEMDWARAWQWRPPLLIAGAIAIFPYIWLASLKVQPLVTKLENHGVPVAGVVAVLLVAAMCVMLDQPRLRWFLTEWAKVRTANPSFARNTLFWEQREFEVFGDDQAHPRIAFVGSSQMYQAIDGEIVRQYQPDSRLEKNCLAGFGPMQYDAFYTRILERRPDVVVCWLSEFDFYREDELPANRIRWAADSAACYRLLESIRGAAYPDAVHPNLVAWQNRAHLADLTFASFVSLWRYRDHLHRAVWGYWWNVATPADRVAPGEGSLLATTSELADAREALSRNIGRKRMVDVNFRCYERFGRELTQCGVKVIVFEGRSHPIAMGGYPPDLRDETRDRLRKLADDVGLTYVGESEMPSFSEADFADGTHLNATGRAKFSHFVGRYLQVLSDPGNSHRGVLTREEE